MTPQPFTAQPFTATIPWVPPGSDRGANSSARSRATGAGRVNRSGLEACRLPGLRFDAWSALASGGLDSIPVNTFSYYDQMLDTAVMLGALPQRVAGHRGDLDRYFAVARGTAETAPLAMTKWFDTNYHYMVPEFGPGCRFGWAPPRRSAS